MAPVDRRGFATTLAAGATAAAVRGPSLRPPADPNEWWNLWPAGLPLHSGPPLAEQIIERSGDPACPDRAMLGITRPRMAIFRPARPNGAAVLVIPGGGYVRVVMDKEGFEFARWLAARGYTACVLFYRLPGEGWASGPDTPLIDAQRAIRLVRHRAAGLGVDPARVATAGFSAGGHVCSDLAARFAFPAYTPVDAADALPTRPWCAAPIYPVVSMDAAIAHVSSRALLLGPNPPLALERAHSPDHNVPADAPPHFLVHAEDDTSVPVENSLALRAALRRRGIPVETHLFAEGGHGFGLRRAAGKPAAIWPELWAAWAARQGLAAA
jgi:acetyl esterase/lipase